MLAQYKVTIVADNAPDPDTQKVEWDAYDLIVDEAVESAITALENRLRERLNDPTISVVYTY